MTNRSFTLIVTLCATLGLAGCATDRQSHTARTGVEQMLISSAVDRSLDQVDLTPLRHRKVFLETKYLDCVDKNYVIVSLHHRLLHTEAKLVDKADNADVILEIASGAVGTDSQDLFVGIPEIPLPPPSPIAIPRLAFLTRSRLNGTAKLLVLAYEADTKEPVIRSGIALARSDQNHWNVLGTGTITTGSVPQELAAATGEVDFNLYGLGNLGQKVLAEESTSTPPQQVLPVNHESKEK
jgi:hypothetical protein